LFSGQGKEVKQIVRVFSLDLVYRPARGGAFLRALNSMQDTNPSKEIEEMEAEKLNEKVEVEDQKLKDHLYLPTAGSGSSGNSLVISSCYLVLAHL